MAGEQPFRLRRRHYLLAFAVYLALLGAWAPASLLAWAVPRFTTQSVWLERVQGSVWRGEAEQVRVTLADRSALRLGGLQWRLKPAELLRGRLGYTLRLSGAGADAAGGLSVGWRDTRVQALRAELPASMLATLSPGLDLWQPGGRLLLETSRLAFSRQAGVEGEATLRWLDAVSSRVRTPLGSYRATLAGTASGFDIRLSTEAGPLQLQGTGTWTRGRGLILAGLARGEGEGATELEGLLNMIGPVGADGSRALRVGR